MRTVNLSEAGLLIQVDVQELQILTAALNALCNVGDILDELEQRHGGTKDKAETLLISIRSLNALFDRLSAQSKHSRISQRPKSKIHFSSSRNLRTVGATG